jgi:hypothetical protein
MQYAELNYKNELVFDNVIHIVAAKEKLPEIQGAFF